MLSRLMGTKEQELEIPGLPRDFAKVVARIQGREPSNDYRLRLAAGQDAASVMAISTAINAKPPEPEKPAFDPRTLKIGQVVDGKGIYMGEWKPKDEDGKTLGQIFDLYAAPENTGEDRPFNSAVDHVASLRDWHGNNGGRFENHHAVIKAIKNNPEALSDWFIPTLDILKDFLYANRNEMPKQHEMKTEGDGAGGPWYWSCTERRGHSSYVHGVDFRDGYGVGWDRKVDELSVRPVRAELRL